MDLVGYDEAVFEQIVEELTDWTARLDIADITFIPISALHGDNVVERSLEMAWYDGPPLLYHLEHVVIAPDRNLTDIRFPVQWVIRPGTPIRGSRLPRLRRDGCVGGVLHPGDEVLVLPERPAHRDRRDRHLRGPGRDRLSRHVGDRCGWPTSSTSRAATCSSSPTTRRPRRASSTRCCAGWARTPLQAGGAAGDQAHHADHPGARRGARLPGRRQHAGSPAADELALNEIGRVRIRTGSPLIVDPYRPQPHHRQLHPDRRGVQRHGGRRDGAGRALSPCGRASPRSGPTVGSSAWAPAEGSRVALCPAAPPARWS